MYRSKSLAILAICIIVFVTAYIQIEEYYYQKKINTSVYRVSLANSFGHEFEVSLECGLRPYDAVFIPYRGGRALVIVQELIEK